MLAPIKIAPGPASHLEGVKYVAREARTREAIVNAASVRHVQFCFGIDVSEINKAFCEWNRQSGRFEAVVTTKDHRIFHCTGDYGDDFVIRNKTAKEIFTYTEPQRAQTNIAPDAYGVTSGT